ncbi:MAG TPA: cation:proton antiporter, partial [Noviherbaspirillum sp.]|nr:cation:proton antiporter [Noviherbaspirillum sp.]
TLTVLLVALLAAWTTSSLGLSLAFGAFLAGMMLGETEFRHQVEATIRPFRDVLLGLFFIGVGMLFDPTAIPAIWHWAVAGTIALLSIKTVLVMLLVRRAGLEDVTAWRTGLLLAVGGEFGFALLALALGANVIDARLGQIALTSVLFSMIAGPFLIRYNRRLAKRLSRQPPAPVEEGKVPQLGPETAPRLREHVIICGYGRIGQSVGNFLEEEHIPFVALDLDPVRVREAHTAGEPVFYGDAGERDILELLGLEHARLVVISHEDVAAAKKVLQHLRTLRPELPVMVRTRDETHVDELHAAGALEVVPETLEAGLMIASQALLLLDVPVSRVVRRIQQQRTTRYRLMREFFRGDPLSEGLDERDGHRLRAIVIAAGSTSVGRRLDQLPLDGATITALVRAGERQPNPQRDTVLEANDVLVVFGPQASLERAERAMQ